MGRRPWSSTVEKGGNHDSLIPKKSLLALQRKHICLCALRLPAADIQEDRPEWVDGAVLSHALHLLAPQLPRLHLVRPTLRLLRRCTSRNRQHHRRRLPARVHRGIHRLRRRQEEGGFLLQLKVSLLLVGVFCAFGLIVYVSMTLFDHKPRQTFVGYLSVASLICMFASPLSVINLVIKTKSVEYMPFYLSLSMSLMSVSFFAYGVLLDDFFIYIPNGIGTVLGVIQLLLYAYFRKGSRDEARRPLLVAHT